MSNRNETQPGQSPDGDTMGTTTPEDRFFSFDGENYETHLTPEAASNNCDRALDYFRDEADEGWREDVERIAWGPIAERVVETLWVEHQVGEGWGDRIDYGLVPMPKEVRS